MGLREIKAKARAQLHDAMSVPAYFMAARGSDPVPCSVRVHTKFGALGDLKGTSFSYAETREEIPKLLFWRSQVEPTGRNNLVTISADEGYRLDTVDPPDGLTVKAAVVRLSPTEMIGLPYPGA